MNGSEKVPEHPAAVEAAAAVLAAHEHEYERRVSPSHYCSCGEWDGAFGDDGGLNDGRNDTADAYRAHVAEALAAAGLLADRRDLPVGDGCHCPPCPGRGNDGHGMTHCAECCFGTGVEPDLDCPIHGERAALADPTAGQTGADEGEAR